MGMGLVSVPTKPKQRYIEYCLAAKNAATWSEYKTAELKARVCGELIKDFWPEAWFIIISEADEAVEVPACCGIVFRTYDEFPKDAT
jgi:hypothetical protein